MTPSVVDLIKSAKASYRATARRKSWEEKVADIERMREASKLARESMRLALRKGVE